MKIRKADEKPMDIHIKEKAKIHKVEPKKLGQKGEELLSGGNKGKYQSLQPQIRKSGGRNESVVKLAGEAGLNAAADQMEGGEDLKESAMTAYLLSRPVTGTVSKGSKLFREKSLEERFRKIKAVRGGEKVSSQTAKKTAKKTGKKAAKKTAKKTVKDTSKAAAKATAKETSKAVVKETAKVTAKVAASAAGTAAGTAATGVAGPLIGIAAGELVGLKMDVEDARFTSRARKMKFFMDKMKEEGKQTDSVGKLVRDLILNQARLFVKQGSIMMATFIIPMLSLILLVALPVLLIIAILYNSPYALFLPSVQDTDTVQTVTSAYVAEFQEEIHVLATDHTEYDTGEIIFVDYEGTSASPTNYCDIMCVYMVKYGVGDAASIMNDKSKQWLQGVVDDMCSYTLSERTETTQDEEGNEVTQTILQVHVTIKDYRDMISVYGFDTDQIELLEDMMSSQYLAMLGYSPGAGNSQSSIEASEIEAILDTVTNDVQKRVCSFALSKVGYPYSQDYRDSGEYFDCSSLAFYAWKAAGIDISYGGSTTAAAEAQGLAEAGKTVTYEELQPGDLIFYSFVKNGRYLDISHVAIYVGNGKVVEAQSEQYGVVYGDISGSGSIVLIGRP